MGKLSKQGRGEREGTTSTVSSEKRKVVPTQGKKVEDRKKKTSGGGKRRSREGNTQPVLGMEVRRQKKKKGGIATQVRGKEKGWGPGSHKKGQRTGGGKLPRQLSTTLFRNRGGPGVGQ